jgi:hypothetical protein
MLAFVDFEASFIAIEREGRGKSRGLQLWLSKLVGRLKIVHKFLNPYPCIT